MKTTKILSKAILVACLLCLALTVNAQKRRTTSKKVTKSSTASTQAANAAEVKASAEKVSIQIKNVSKFIYVLGGIAQGIQDVDNDVKAKKASKNAIDLNNKSKQSVVASIRNLRAGLDALEQDFSTKPALRAYLLQIEGISGISAAAEEQANAGQFVESGKTLLQVIEKLSDTLAAMP